MKYILSFTLSIFTTFIIICFISPLFYSDNVIIPYSLKPYNICKLYPVVWHYIKLFYIIFSFLSFFIIYKSIFSKLFSLFNKFPKDQEYIPNPNKLDLFLGYNSNNTKIYICEKGLFQNILVTGTIGTGKTSSAMYPFTKQIISYKHSNSNEKIGMLILDVKGNYHNEVKKYCNVVDREDDLILIEIGGKFSYNPLDKPNLKANVLANRLKTILTLFSNNTSDTYWLDKAEQVLTECIKLCRLYNNGYVTFLELHKLITISDYYLQKTETLRLNFQKGCFSPEDSYNLLTSIEFFENEFKSLDSRVLSIIKSEISRITNTFINDYQILKTFCPEKSNLNFCGFKDVIEKGKIVVLNINIAEYRNLSKIIAAYLKLDFQSEVMAQLAHKTVNRITSFICDEFHEYVTSTDAEFFSESREAKCINIVATQSYTSLLNTLKDTSTVKVILQNLINKLWFRTDDSFTIEEVQKQIGKEDKIKISRTISENAKETNFNYFTNSLNSQNSSISESINSNFYHEFTYDTNFFTQELETFSALSFLSTGNKILKPTKIKLCPYFADKTHIYYTKGGDKL